MASAERSSPQPALENPYEPPASLSEWPARLVRKIELHGLPAEPIRLAGIRSESTIRALGIASYLFCFLWSLDGLNYIATILSVLQGRITAHWIGWPYYVITKGVMPAMIAPAFALLGRGLSDLQSWSRRIGIVLIAAVSLNLLVVAVRDTNREGILVGMAAIPLVLGFAVLFSPIFGSAGAHVLSDEYRRVVERTPDIKVRPKLPIGLKLAWLFFLALAAGSFYAGSR